MNGASNKMNSKFINQNSSPITLTWNVSAYVKNKSSVFRKLKRRIRPDDDNQYDYSANSFQQSIEDTKFKPILKNGSFKIIMNPLYSELTPLEKSTLFSLLFYFNTIFIWSVWNCETWSMLRHHGCKVSKLLKKFKKKNTKESLKW